MVADTFKHIRLETAGDVLLVEVLSQDIQGPDRAKEFINDLTEAVGRDGNRPILLDLGKVRYLSSMGYSALFKMVKCARERGRPIRFCNIHDDVRAGAEAVGLSQVVTVHSCQDEARAAFVAS
jgi:anti-anti-sigma factor